MTFMTEVDPVVTEGSLLADETSKEEQLKAAAERINNAELTEGELDESMAPEHYEASDLRVLEGLEAVRIRPGMYIGSTGPRGLHHLVYEIVDNSVDEALAGYASHIEVTILSDNGIRVVDDGRGIPVDEVPGEGVSGVETVMTKLHAGGKFGGGGYAVSGGLHGVGISVVNALSTRVDIEVRRQGFHWTQTYIDQHPTAPLKQDEPMTEGESTGTSVTFWADPKIFETTIYDFETLRSRFQQMAFLNKGLKISLTDERENDQAGDEVAGDAADEPGAKHQTVTYQYLNGIKDYVDYLVKVRKATPVEEDVISFEAEDLKLGISAELAMQWTTAYSEAVHTFANTISTTEGGTHEEGFRAALTSLVNRYARDKGILKDKDENLSGDDVREGLTAVISVKLTNPQFEGQTKTKLGNSEAKTFVQRVMTDKLGDWFDAHPNEAKNIIQKAIEASRARLAAKKARENTRRKSIFESAGMPDKLKDCQSNNPEECELFIVEGDSAGGSAIQGRNPITQAILPLRGKILNTERASLDRHHRIADHRGRRRLRRGLRHLQGPLPQGHHHGRCRCGWCAYRHPEPDAVLPLHAPDDHRRLRVRGHAAAVPPEVDQGPARLRVHRRRARPRARRRQGQRTPAAQGRRHPALQGSGRDELPGAMGDHHGPRAPHSEAGAHRGRRRGRRDLLDADGR